MGRGRGRQSRGVESWLRGNSHYSSKAGAARVFVCPPQPARAWPQAPADAQVCSPSWDCVWAERAQTPVGFLEEVVWSREAGSSSARGQVKHRGLSKERKDWSPGDQGRGGERGRTSKVSTKPPDGVS